MRTTLSEVQRFYPQVTQVTDADTVLELNITAQDIKTANNKSPTECVVAKAIIREYHVEGAIIRPSVAYVIQDNVAIRYSIPQSVSREIVTFDRKQDFDPGRYHLASMLPSRRSRARARTYRKNKKKHARHKRKLQFHHTAGIRRI